MPQAVVAFVNTYNLFPPGTQNGRPGPADMPALQTKLESLRHMVVSGGYPTFLGLCEVGDESYVQELVAALPDSYSHLWAGPAPGFLGMETGLALLYQTALMQLQEVHISLHQRRPHWLAALFQFREGSRAPLWVVVQHWPSQRNPEVNRLRVARSVGEFYQETARPQTENILLFGDLNCEPFERPFCERSLPFQGARSREYAQRPRAPSSPVL